MDTAIKPQHLVWNEGYVLGIKSLDAHHRQLIFLANELCDVLLTGANMSARLEWVVKELVDFTVYSLDFEADCLFQFEYPERYLHIEQHELFKEKVSWFKSKIHANAEDLPMLKLNMASMWKFLSIWLDDHIAICDQSFKTVMIENGIQ